LDPESEQADDEVGQVDVDDDDEGAGVLVAVEDGEHIELIAGEESDEESLGTARRAGFFCSEEFASGAWPAAPLLAAAATGEGVRGDADPLLRGDAFPPLPRGELRNCRRGELSPSRLPINAMRRVLESSRYRCAQDSETLLTIALSKGFSVEVHRNGSQPSSPVA